MWMNVNPAVVSAVLVAAVAARVAAAAGFQHTAILDQHGDFVMRWTPGEESIRVEIEVATTGWVGLGFSSSGGMRGADITLGWVDSHGKVHVHDRYAHGTTTPVVDQSQDVVVEGGYQNDTHTVLRFLRPWTTCDTEQDFKLSGDTTRVIWAFGEEDPVDEMTMQRHTQRGVKSLFLQEPGVVPPPLTEDIGIWDIRAPNVTLPSHADTLYWCKLYKTPEFISNVHLIGYEPLISEDNIAYVHHIALYACSDSSPHLDKWTQHDGVQCYSPNMPPSWFSCTSVFVAWAVGGEGEMWPDNVGISLGGQSGYNYFVMEMHYDNPQLSKGIVDDSGIRFLYTTKLRKYDAAVLTVGAYIDHHMIVPPVQSWTTVGHCGSPCLEEAFPAEGVRVIQILQHAHLLGREITLRHLRGNRELPVVLQDRNYDFNYQIARRLKEELTVLPEDSLMVECQYDAEAMTVPTFGGEGTREEMCLAFLLYYPRVSMTHCESHPVPENIYHALGVKNIYPPKNELSTALFDEEKERQLAEAFLERNEDPSFELKPSGAAYKNIVVQEPTSLSNKTVYDILFDEKTWSDEKKVKALQKQTEFGTHRLRCSSGGKNVWHDYEYPHFITFKTLDSECSETHESQVYQTVTPERKKQDFHSLALQPSFTLSLLLSSAALLLLVLK